VWWAPSLGFETLQEVPGVTACEQAGEEHLGEVHEFADGLPADGAPIDLLVNNAG
jgi:hypothetical protein